MSIGILQERLDSYNVESPLEEEIALKEIFQEIALAALGRTDYFKYASFQGGTALRILHSLERFSEDLDFLLKHPDPDFELQPYLNAISLECEAFGMQLEIKDRSKADVTVKKAFLKDSSLGKILSVQFPDKRSRPKKLKIKLEVDTNPPRGSTSEVKYLDFPFPSAVTLQDLPSLFSGKCHALLCREYLKGRDWYDFLWYVSRLARLNWTFLESGLKQQNCFEKNTVLTKAVFFKMLREKMQKINWGKAAEDVSPFLKRQDRRGLELWCSDFFLSRVDKIESYLREKES